MFLQIMPPENVVTTPSKFDTELLFVFLGLAIGVFLIIRLAKYFYQLNTKKNKQIPTYTREELDFS